MQKNNEYNTISQDGIKIARSLLLGTAVGAVVCAMLLSLSAMVLVKTGSLPLAALPIITTAIGAVGSFFAGYTTIMAYKRRGLLLGCVSGILLFFIVLICGMLKGAESTEISSVIKAAVFILLGGAGGVVRVNRRVKVR